MQEPFYSCNGYYWTSLQYNSGLKSNRAGKARTMSDYSDSDLNLAQLLQVKAPPAAKGFHAFWHAAYATVQDFRPEIKLKLIRSKKSKPNWQVF